MHNPVVCNFRLLGILTLLLGYLTDSFGQKGLEPPPALQTDRSLESYSYLKDSTSNPYQKAVGDELKYISLNDSGNLYLSVGGSYRARLESFTNKDWTTTDDTYYSQRLSLHASLHLGKHLRLFGELYHGLSTGQDRLFQDDEVDWHQGFLEVYFPSDKNDPRIGIKLGRQELDLGTARLIGRRDGTNIRRSFDLAKLSVEKASTEFQVFYGREVSPQFGAFDNDFSLLVGQETNPKLWGAYTKWTVKENVHELEAYYLGFRSDIARMSDLIGKETRHSVGIRSYGKVGRFTFNTELVYQFGELGEGGISAYNFETDWKYIFIDAKWRPILGIKLDFSSGDREIGDDKLQTYNPLFVNPGIYSLAAVNTPANLSSFHPSITFFPLKKLTIYMDYALFFRTSRKDGLYAPPRFLSRAGTSTDDKHIGDVLGLNANYSLNRNISLNLLSSYFIAGGFIEATGSSENIFYLATTLSFLL